MVLFELFVIFNHSISRIFYSTTTIDTLDALFAHTLSLIKILITSDVQFSLCKFVHGTYGCFNTNETTENLMKMHKCKGGSERKKKPLAAKFPTFVPLLVSVHLRFFPCLWFSEKWFFFRRLMMIFHLHCPTSC